MFKLLIGYILGSMSGVALMCMLLKAFYDADYSSEAEQAVVVRISELCCMCGNFSVCDSNGSRFLLYMLVMRLRFFASSAYVQNDFIGIRSENYDNAYEMPVTVILYTDSKK